MYRKLLTRKNKINAVRKQKFSIYARNHRIYRWHVGVSVHLTHERGQNAKMVKKNNEMGQHRRIQSMLIVYRDEQTSFYGGSNYILCDCFDDFSTLAIAKQISTIFFLFRFVCVDIFNEQFDPRSFISDVKQTIVHKNSIPVKDSDRFRS